MEIILSRLNYFGYYITMKNIIISLYLAKLGMFGHAKTTRIPLYYYIWAAPKSTGSRQDSRWQQCKWNNQIFYRRAKTWQIFRGYFVPRADTQIDIFPTLLREKGVISFHVQKILLLFSIWFLWWRIMIPFIMDLALIWQFCICLTSGSKLAITSQPGW